VRANIQRACSWCGIITALCFFGGFAIAGFLPPPPPTLGADELAAIYRENHTSIMIGMMVWMVSGMFMTFFIGILAEQVRRIEGSPRCLYFAQVAAGALNIVFFTVPPTLVIVTAYRPDRLPELTYVLNDLSWIVAILPWPGASAQSLAVGLAILADTSRKPIFPRWTGYYSIFCGIGFVLGTGLIFVTTGPFTWRGVFPFWFDGSIFFIWFFVMHYALLRAIRTDPKNLPTVAFQDSSIPN
jgi:MFS family permease